MGDDRPPWPGSAPPAFDFPFDQAERAHHLAEELSADLVTLRQAHQQARHVIEDGAFSGMAADRFRARFDRHHDDLERQTATLDDQVDTIDAHLATARDRLDAHRAAWWEWHLAYEAWLSWTPTA